MLRRGFTLIELIVAVSLVVVMTGLVAPLLSEVLRDRAEDSALRDLRSAFSLARDDARRLDEPIRLVARIGPTGEVELRVTLLGREGSLASDGGEAAAAIDADGMRGGGSLGPGFDEPPSSAGLVLTLPARLWIRRVDDAISRVRVVEDPLATSEWWDEAAPDESAKPEPGSTLTMAIFLPDGSALGSAPMELVGRSGPVARLTVNPWTGELRIERRARGSEGGRDAGSLAASAMDGPPVGADSTGRPGSGSGGGP